MIFILGEGGSGKTTLSFDILDRERKEGLPRAVILAPDRTNPRMDPLDFTTDGDGDIDEMAQTFRDSKTDLLVIMENENPRIFEELRRKNEDGAPFYPIIMGDDMGAMLGETEMKRAFKAFVRNIRSRQQIVMLSTHRVVDDLPANAHMVTKWILWVGPMASVGEADKLYEMGNIRTVMDRETFREKIAALPVYNWKLKNQDAILAVKQPNMSQPPPPKALPQK